MILNNSVAVAIASSSSVDVFPRGVPRALLVAVIFIGETVYNAVIRGQCNFTVEEASDHH